jgi:hypothetical protein
VKSSTKALFALFVAVQLCACRREIISTADDPVTVVKNAETKFSKDFTHRCRMESTGNSGPGWQDKQLYEVAAADRYRIVSEKKNGTQTQQGELLVIREDIYQRQDEGPWRKLGPEWGAYFRRSGGPPMPMSSAIGYRIDSGSLRFTGREDVEGEPSLRYQMDIDDHVEMKKTIVYWVGAYDGLPHKTEESVQTKMWGSAPMTRRAVMYCSYGEHPSIKAPL